MKRIVAYLGSRPFYEDMVTAVKSLLFHTEVDKIYLMIADDKFPFKMPECVESVNLAKLNFFPVGSPNYENPWSNIILNRVALPKIFPDDDVVLSMDVDAIVDRDISPIWDYPIESYYVAGVPEKEKSKGGKIYINYGVALVNLKKLRNDGMDDVMIRELNKRHIGAPDQTCVNEMCQGKILALPSEYNSNSFTEKCENPRIVHFAGIGEYFSWSGKSWRNELIVEKYRSMTWDEVLRK
jgi:lipopolysaccharide biosynthesis glycosyltransferase